jgi:predicted SAM-dependent methyltransferase
MFSHGAMDRPDYALGVFKSHYDRTFFARKGRDFVGLEIGPGDSIASAIIARAHGADRCVLVDAGAYATKDLEPYRQVAKLLSDRGLEAPRLDGAASLREVLALCRGEYLTDGLTSLRDVPSASVDFIWSHAVLEHIRVDEFLPTMRELRRIVRSDGVCSHRVDLQDHLGGQLNNMRIPSHLWERDWMARSGFYTNRIRMRQMVGLFEEAGFAVDVPWTAEWSRIPTARSSMAREFHNLSDADLLVYAFDAVLRPA